MSHDPMHQPLNLIHPSYVLPPPGLNVFNSCQPPTGLAHQFSLISPQHVLSSPSVVASPSSSSDLFMRFTPVSQVLSPSVLSTDLSSSYEKDFRIISWEELKNLLSDVDSENRVESGLLPDGRAYAPKTAKRDNYFLFPSKSAYILYFIHYYFSHDNLNRDQKIRQMMIENTAISIDNLIQAPRLASIGTTCNDMEQAIYTSNILCLLDLPDGKRGVKRIDGYPGSLGSNNMSGEIKRQFSADSSLYADQLPSPASDLSQPPKVAARTEGSITSPSPETDVKELVIGEFHNEQPQSQFTQVISGYTVAAADQYSQQPSQHSATTSIAFNPASHYVNRPMVRGPVSSISNAMAAAFSAMSIGGPAAQQSQQPPSTLFMFPTGQGHHQQQMQPPVAYRVSEQHPLSTAAHPNPQLAASAVQNPTVFAVLAQLIQYQQQHAAAAAALHRSATGVAGQHTQPQLYQHQLHRRTTPPPQNQQHYYHLQQQAAQPPPFYAYHDQPHFHFADGSTAAPYPNFRGVFAQQQPQQIQQHQGHHSHQPTSQHVLPDSWDAQGTLAAAATTGINLQYAPSAPAQLTFDQRSSVPQMVWHLQPLSTHPHQLSTIPQPPLVPQSKATQFEPVKPVEVHPCAVDDSSIVAVTDSGDGGKATKVVITKTPHEKPQVNHVQPALQPHTVRPSRGKYKWPVKTHPTPRGALAAVNTLLTPPVTHNNITTGVVNVSKDNCVDGTQNKEAVTNVSDLGNILSSPAE